MENDTKTEEETEDEKGTDANEGATSTNADSRQLTTGEQEAMDATCSARSGEEVNEGEEFEGGDTEEEITAEELRGPNCPMLVLPSEEGGMRINPRLAIGSLQREVLSQWGVGVNGSGNIVWEGMRNDKEVPQNTTRNRKTCDGGDPQEKDNTSESRRGEK